ncbi:MAG: hypothetical protein MJZ99_06980 [Bacteroidales bacterium]|nr:hypothetical protein [Bacteroidales bacterium]
MTRLQKDLYAGRYQRMVRTVDKVINLIGTGVVGAAMAWILVNGFFPA